MRSIFSMLLAIMIAGSAAVFVPGGVADAAFHCVRIHAVAGSFNGDNTIQYVELRMDVASQTLLTGHAVQFFDAGGALKATFTFPGGITNGSTGDSILIGTSEFNSHATGGAADYTFTAANTVGANGGDPLHPVQAPNGSVVWAGPNLACLTAMAPVDAVSYGTAPAIYGTAATALPTIVSNKALRLSNLAIAPTNNSTEYALQSVSSTTFTVALANLATDFTTPRNNARHVLSLNASILGGVDQDPGIASTAGSSVGNGLWYAIAGAVAAATVTCGAGWYVFRVRTA